MTDSIVRAVTLAAPIERVWQAIADHRGFGSWFGVALDGPFRLGETATGRITHPGYEHLRWTALVTTIDAPHRFAFTWHPYAVDPTVDYDAEPPTLVGFTLEPDGGGTRLTVRESGFDGVPEVRREEALRMNASGWTAQMKNIGAYLAR